jgi:hypothetical protein
MVNYIEAYIHKTRVMPLKWYKYGRRLVEYFENVYSGISRVNNLNDLIIILETNNYQAMNSIISIFQNEPVFQNFIKYYNKYFLYRIASAIKAFPTEYIDTDIYDRLFASEEDEDVTMDDSKTQEQKELDTMTELIGITTNKIINDFSTGNTQIYPEKIGSEAYNYLINIFSAKVYPKPIQTIISEYIDVLIRRETVKFAFKLLMVLKHYSIYKKDESKFIIF